MDSLAAIFRTMESQSRKAIPTKVNSNNISSYKCTEPKEYQTKETGET